MAVAVGGLVVYFNLKILRVLFEVNRGRFGGFRRIFARSSFGLGVKLYFYGGCYRFRSKEVNGYAIRTVATTNLKLEGLLGFWFSRVWMRLEILPKSLTRRA